MPVLKDFQRGLPLIALDDVLFLELGFFSKFVEKLFGFSPLHADIISKLWQASLNKWLHLPRKVEQRINQVDVGKRAPLCLNAGKAGI